MSGAAASLGAAAAKPYQNHGRNWALNYKKLLRTLRRRVRQTKHPIGKWRIVRGDTVMLLAGKDEGKTGKVKAINRKKQRVWVEGVNFVRAAAALGWR